MTDPTRTLKDVANLVSEKLDTMTDTFSDICCELERKRMFGTFACDGELYLITLTECPDDVRAELGYPVPKRVFCWHCEERIIGKVQQTDDAHPNCGLCPTWAAGCLDEECEACA